MSNRYVGGVVTETTNVAQSPWSGSWTEQAAMQGFGSVLRIPNSLRFRSSASAYLNRTPSVAGNQKTWTWSGWVKRGDVGANSASLFTTKNPGPGSMFVLYFLASGQIDVANVTANVSDFALISSAVFRDPSAWYHVICAVDTTQATASNRVKVYVNGSQITSFSTSNYPTQNFNTYVNSVIEHDIAIWNNNGGISNVFDGYMAEVNFVDGQALPPTAFGAINKETGVWAPITYTGTYGLNGFRLNFFNGTSTTTLGYDSSGNGNNWTTNNISLTAGSTYDWMIDSPSKIQGTSYGVGNYAVLNPLAGTSGTVADGNLGLTTSTSDYSTRISTIGMTTGKWYFEATQLSYSGNNQPAVAIVNPSFAITGDLGAANSWAYYGRDGNKYTSGSGSAYGATYGNNDVIGVAFDADAGTLTFYKNNTSQGTAFTGLTSGPYFFAIGDTQGSSSSVFVVNFGQRPFAYTPPSGYQTLCTQNLPVATIYNGAQYMAATLYTGNGSSQTVTNAVNGVSFTPDFVWNKGRSVAYYHSLVDVIRGNSNVLFSNATDAEQNPGAQLDITTNGFISTYRSANLANNQSGETYVGWQWKAGGTAVSNNAGSITSSVSANTTAGFSVVTYSGNSTVGATVGHGLGAAPNMVIFKTRNAAGNYWDTYHSSLGATKYLLLNLTDAAATSSWLNNTAPSSSVITLSNFGDTNQSGLTYVAYCFAAIPGYSAFGSYTGNGSTDGPFTYTGFRPRYLLIKNSSATSQWRIADTSRSPYNQSIYSLRANDSTAENSTNCDIDFLSNGFKIRGTGTDQNDSGNVYIYAAFAENPFSVALAR